MPDCIAHLLDNVRVSQPKTFGSLTMFPLVAGSAVEGTAYLTLDEALAISNKAVAEALDGLPPMKMHCSLLAEEAVRAAINDYFIKTTGKGLGDAGSCCDADSCTCAGHRGE